MDCKIKAPTAVGRMWLVGLEIFDIQPIRSAGASARNVKSFNAPSAIPQISECTLSNDCAGR